jgi:hypothetical protein
VRVSYYDPDQRALEKAVSRRRDEEALISGRISREDLQRVNGAERVNDYETGAGSI